MDPSCSASAGPRRDCRTSGRRRLLGGGLAVVAVLALAACGDQGPATDDASSPSSDRTPTSGSSTGTPTGDATPTPSPTASPTASAPPAGSPSASATPLTTSAVYFVADTRTGLRLVREQRDLPGADPTTEAVQGMIAGPQDPDYRSAWNPRTKVLSVVRKGNELDVDLSTAARKADVGSEAADRMVQQLVYTATEAAGIPGGKVRLLIGGRPAGDLWGAVTWTSPVGRADPAQVQSLVQIDSPRDGTTTASPVRVLGVANAFEANVPWQVLDGNGTVVKEGATTAREGMRLSPYSFKVALPPGTYTLRIAEDDPSGGEGGAPMVDTKRITVE